jgi:hypothetical protein
VTSFPSAVRLAIALETEARELFAFGILGAGILDPSGWTALLATQGESFTIGVALCSELPPPPPHPFRAAASKMHVPPKAKRRYGKVIEFFICGRFAFLIGM